MASRYETFIGIDPGLSGAVALIIRGTACVFDTPTASEGRKNKYLPAQMREILDSDLRAFAALEQAHAMPGQGVTSMFSFGEGYGIWQGLLAGLQIPYDIVTPQKWKKEMLSGRQKGKSASRIRAQEIFPYLSGHLNLVKHDGRAEALLIAEYIRRLLAP